MVTIKLHEQIAFLRKQKGLTQGEVARALGVTNQAVSKWESGACCPDIQLLPEIAEFLDVTVDELIGYKRADGLGDICLKLKNYFIALPERQAFENAYRIAALLHEIVVTDGYKEALPWKKDKDYSGEEVGGWGVSISSEPEGSTMRKNNSICFSLGKGYSLPDTQELERLSLKLGKLHNITVLKVMYGLYGLTAGDSGFYAGSRAIAEESGLSTEETEAALEQLPVAVKEENQMRLYRLEASFYPIPPLLSFLDSGEYSPFLAIVPD